MKPRLSTQAAMVAALSALDDRARFCADLTRGVAHGLAAGGADSEHTHVATDHDRGRWLSIRMVA